MADERTFQEVEFISRDAKEIFADLVSGYEALTGRTLGQADPIRLLLGWEASIDAQIYASINETAKLNVPRYAYGEYQDSIAENFFYELERMEASCAVTTVRFTISSAQSGATAIPVGTRVTKSGEVVFSVKATTYIPTGSLYADAECVCTTPGIIGNGFAVGSIDVCLDNDNIPNLQSIANTTVSEGGAPAESDEDFYKRMRESMSAWSTAGPEKAYEYHAKSANANIGDAYAVSPQPCYVTVYVMRADGTMPGTELLQEVNAYLTDKSRRPLGDRLTVSAPTAVNYNLNVQWYRETGSELTQTAMAAAVEAAVTEYLEWQNTKMGRDINPDQLIYLLKKAGVKRCKVNQPVFTQVSASQVAQVGTKTITFAGEEDY